MALHNFIAQSLHACPKDEITKSFCRYGSEDLSNGTSIKGRGACLLLIPVHALCIVGKPLIYGTVVVGALTAAALLTAKIGGEMLFGSNTSMDVELRRVVFLNGCNLLANAIISPFGQVAQAIKAAAGVLYPPAYFKKPSARIPHNNSRNNNNRTNNNFFSRNTNNNQNHNRNNNGNNDLVRLEANPIVNNFNLPNDFINNGSLSNAENHHTIGRSAYYIDCQINYPSEKPLEALANLVMALRRPCVTHLSVSYYRQDGSDAGGLSRDYIYRLFNSLSRELRLQDGLVYHQEQNKDVLGHIGIALSFMLKGLTRNNSNSEYTIGDSLPSLYFKGLLSLNYNEINEPVETLLPERIIEILCSAEDPTATKLNAFLDWNGSDSDTPEGQAHIQFARDCLLTFADANEMPTGAICYRI